MVLESLRHVEQVLAVRTEGEGEEGRVEDQVAVEVSSLHLDSAVESGVPHNQVEDGVSTLESLHSRLRVLVPFDCEVGRRCEELLLYLGGVLVPDVAVGPVVNVNLPVGVHGEPRVLDDLLVVHGDHPGRCLPDLLVVLLSPLPHTALVVSLAQGEPHGQGEETDQEGLGQEEGHQCWQSLPEGSSRATDHSGLASLYSTGVTPCILGHTQWNSPAGQQRIIIVGARGPLFSINWSHSTGMELSRTGLDFNFSM